MQTNYIVNNLRKYIKNTSKTDLEYFLSGFHSPQNPDVEHFLKANAIDFTNKSQSVTYLVMSSSADLLGYFSLAIKPVTIPLGILSNTQIKKLQRMSNIDGDSNSITISAYLIAQLGKNYSIPKESRIDGKELLNLAYEKIASLKYDAGGIAVFLECEENDFLLDFYAKNNHFEFGTRKTSNTVKEGETITLHQFLKFI